MSSGDPTPDDTEIAERLRFLIAQIEADDIEARRSAVREIADISWQAGELVKPAVSLLVKCLSDPDEQIGESAVWALRNCAPESIEALIDCLLDADSLVKRRACESLANIGEQAASASDALRNLLGDLDQDVRRRAAFALGLTRDTSDRTIVALCAMARSKNAMERAAALHALGNLGKVLADPRALQANQQEILDALEDGNEDVRWSACYVLRSLKPETKLYVGLLVRRLAADASSRVRSMAIDQLKELITIADLADHIPLMCDVVRKGERDAREMCELLASLGKGARQAVPCLVEAVRSDDAFLVVSAAEALWKIDRRLDEALPQLQRIFGDYGESVCDAICTIGPAAAPLIDRVIDALQSDDWDLQWAAADALGALSSTDPKVTTALINALGHSSPIVNNAAARALASVGPVVVPPLIAVLEKNGDTRSAGAAHALGQIGTQASAAVGVLRNRMRSRDPHLAPWCAIALAKIASDPEAIPILIELLAQTDRRDLLCEAAIGLKAIGPSAISATEALIAALDADDASVRKAVEEALISINARKH
jgi:HEAT repeat protein